MSGPAPTAAEYFGAMVERYDSLIGRAVPRYDEMIDRLVEHLPRHAPRVLELGCGTGNLTLRLLDRDPGAHVRTVDAAPEMTDVAARRAGARPRPFPLATITARFEELSFPAESFDLVVSCMSLHHVVDKAQLYSRVRRWLAPGGVFAFADEILGATPESQQIFWDRWLEFCRAPGNCSEEEIASLVDHARAHDHYVPLHQHFSMLSGAGFSVCDCVWRNQMYGVVTAR